MKWSIIVPMGRPERARQTFESLQEQTAIPGKHEIIVVGVKAEEIKDFFPRLPITPVTLPHNMLPPKTRLLGSERAQGEWLVFIDDDMILQEDYFLQADRFIKEWPANDPPPGAIGCRLPGTVGNFADDLVNLGNFWYQQGAEAEEKYWLYSASIIVNGEAYRKIGGFNPSLPNGEDVDLTQRIRAQGYLLYYDPNQVAFHNHERTTFAKASQYFWRNGNTAQYFNQARPAARCFSIKTAVWHASNDSRSNINLNLGKVPNFSLYIPFIYLMYLILQFSMEWHYQQYLYVNSKYEYLDQSEEGDKELVKAFRAFKNKKPLAGFILYSIALFKDFLNPLRR